MEDEDVPTQDAEQDEGAGSVSKTADEPEIGKGTGEGERGLGVQTGASGGGEPTEPEDATPERGQTAGN